MLLPQVSLGSSLSQEEDFFLQVDLQGQCGLFFPWQQVQGEGHKDEDNEDRDRGLEHKLKELGLFSMGKRRFQVGLRAAFRRIPRRLERHYYKGIWCTRACCAYGKVV